MKTTTRLAIFAGLLGVALLVRSDSDNKIVSYVSNSIPDGGIYNLDGSHSGSPLLIEHKGKVIAGKNGFVYCSGFTFAVVMEAAKHLGLLEDKSVENVRKFKFLWYGATGDRERQQGPAMEYLGIGRSIPSSAARDGDFLQLWRTDGSGHSVVFKNWITNDRGEITGIRYRSAQPRSGVSDNTERFKGQGGRVNPSRMYFSRLG